MPRGQEKVRLSRSDLPEISRLSNGNYGHVLRYRVISEDQNRFSHWSPIRELEVYPVTTVQGGVGVAGNIIQAVWGDEENRPNYDVFVNFENEIVSKSLTDNVATIQTNTTHNFIVGSEVVVSGIDATFDGTYSVSSINSATSFSYVRTAADVSETSSDGIVSGYFYHGTTPIHTYSFLSNLFSTKVRVAIQVASIEKERANSITIFESEEIDLIGLS